ncbi:MAG: hypothetical protein WDO19_28820 [Bacteroidota bacterium]
MAELITKQQLKKLPIIPYDKVRDYLKTGYVFFSSAVMRFQALYRN